MNNETKEAMRKYAKLREITKNLEARMNFMVDMVKQSDEYSELQGYVNANKNTLDQLDTEIRSAAIADYQVTGNKKPWDGVGIREVTKYDYDLPKAVEWAKQNMPAILTVDKKKFEKFLSVTSPETLPETIKVYKETTATIASDLSMYKEDEDES